MTNENLQATLADVTADRDEHKKQHANAVQCWRADVTILGATVDALRSAMREVCDLAESRIEYSSWPGTRERIDELRKAVGL